MKNEKTQHEDTRFSSSDQGKRAVKNFKQQLRVSNRTDQTVKTISAALKD